MTARDHTALISALREDLEDADFTVTTLESIWGADADAALHRGERILAERALSRRPEGHRAAAAALAELFVLGLRVPAERVDAALPRLTVKGAVELGLLERQADGFGPRVDLRPYSFVDATGAGSWWIASDLGELALGRALDEDHVLGIGGATTTLTGLMMQRPVESVLDLGTGCGIQAMHASRHARRVVATDISRRALDLAAFNAELNGIHSIEFRHGSLFEPVEGERFDQIVSNPPFVITPRTEGVPAYEYRDGGLEGDAIVEAVIRGAERHLSPGGVAQLLGNWEYRGGVHAFERVSGWLGGLDAWIVEREVQSPAEYAETWIRDGGTRSGTAEFDRLYRAWLDDFEARGVRQIGFGYVTLRRPGPGTAPLRRLERLGSALPGDQRTAGLGPHLEACLVAHDWQAARSDEELLSSVLTVAGDVTEERHYWPGAEDPTAMLLRQGAGFGRQVPLDTGLAALVGACDGELTVGAIVAAIAHLLSADEAALAGDLLPRIRALLDDGFLHPPV